MYLTENEQSLVFYINLASEKYAKVDIPIELMVLPGQTIPMYLLCNKYRCLDLTSTSIQTAVSRPSQDKLISHQEAFLLLTHDPFRHLLGNIILGLMNASFDMSDILSKLDRIYNNNELYLANKIFA